MKPVDYRRALEEAAHHAFSWFDEQDSRPVGPPVDTVTLLAAAPVAHLPAAGIEPEAAIAELARWLGPGLDRPFVQPPG